MQGKGRSILASANDDAADADNVFFARRNITRHIGVMARSIRVRHQHFDVFADGLFPRIAEHPFGGATERLYVSRSVDDRHSIGRGLEDRDEVRFLLVDLTLQVAVGVYVEDDAGQAPHRSVVRDNRAAHGAHPKMILGGVETKANIKIFESFSTLEHGRAHAGAVLRHDQQAPAQLARRKLRSAQHHGSRPCRKCEFAGGYFEHPAPGHGLAEGDLADHFAVGRALHRASLTHFGAGVTGRLAAAQTSGPE